jgi:NitT/TauT family transport system permease protein
VGDARAVLAGERVLQHEYDLHAREALEANRRERRETWAVFGWQACLLAVLLFGWWWSSGRIFDRLFLSDPISVAKAFWRITLDGTLWFHLRYTMAETALGYVFGASLGLAGAMIVALMPGGEPIMRPMILLAFATPKIAIAPLMILWFGIGILPKIVLAATFVFFIVFLNTVAGLGTVSPGLVTIVRVMGARPVTIFRKVVLPAATPFIMAALRITIPAALIGAIVGEFISSNRGVGYLINAASSRYRTAEVFAGILGLLIVVVILNMIVSALERMWLRWAPREQTPLG